MPVVSMRQIEESPTRASTTATMRMDMLSKISDRVQQSQEDSSTGLQQDSDASLPAASHMLNVEKMDDKRISSVKMPGHSSLHRRYEISTLLELGSRVQDTSEILLKIKPEAIAGVCAHDLLSL